MSARRTDSVRLPLPAAGALQLHVSYSDERADFAVVYVHGFGSTGFGEKAQAVEAACARRGWTYATFDFRGHGQSTGTLLELRGSLLLEDLEAIWEHLVARGVQNLCPIGSSMGGWAAAWFTLRHAHHVPACVLMAPALDFVHSRWATLTEEERRRWRETGRLRVNNQWVDAEIGYGLVEEIDQFRGERLAAGLARPILIFHGMRDEVVPYTASVAFLQTAVYPDMELRLFKDGDHRLLAYKDEVTEAACDFFAARINRPRM
jgi:alpha-beta hydrolase superfamily lysophospholipase